TERQELHVRIRPQHPEWDHDQTCRRCTTPTRVRKLNRHQKAIATPWQRLDVPRPARVVAEGFTNLADAEVETLVEVNEGFVVPDLLADLGAADDFAAPSSQDCGHLQRVEGAVG